MGHRLSRIVTKTGDDGTTGLGDGQRIAKIAPRIEACGTVDELNCALGLLLAEKALPESIRESLLESQHDLFDLGGELSIPGSTALNAAHVERLEADAEACNELLPPLKGFVLPGGGRAAAACHVARVVCRRAERRCWTLAQAETVNPHGLRYLNRLSDLLFVMARTLARREGGEVLWRRGRPDSV